MAATDPKAPVLKIMFTHSNVVNFTAKFSALELTLLIMISILGVFMLVKEL